MLGKVERRSKDKLSDSGRYLRGKGTRTFGTEAEEREEHKERNKKCTLCSKPHDLNECEEFGKKTLPERKDLIRKRRLCFGCLKPGHISSNLLHCMILTGSQSPRSTKLPPRKTLKGMIKNG